VRPQSRTEAEREAAAKGERQCGRNAKRMHEKMQKVYKKMHKKWRKSGEMLAARRAQAAQLVFVLSGEKHFSFSFFSFLAP